MLGLVSNCWQALLQAGHDLADCITEAQVRGLTSIELRQTCLGRFEDGDPPRPLAESLTELPQRFPQMRFNIAINVPFLNSSTFSDNRVLQAGIAAAQSVAGSDRPHLRLVDLETIVPTSDGREIAALAGTMRDCGGLLSVEQSRQSWESFRTVFDAARERLGQDSNALQLCYDPVNLLNGDPDEDPIAITGSLQAGEISMVHIKQRRDGAVLPGVDRGDVEWTAVLNALNTSGYRGPFLYEVAPTEAIWHEIENATAYLKTLGFGL